MSKDVIPPGVRRFLLSAIASVPHLEALLLLRGEAKSWSAREVAHRLFIPEVRAAGILNDLVQQSLVAEADPGRFHYAPASDEMRASTDQIVEYYSRHLVEVTQLLHAKLDRGALEFSDAFRFRKEP
jgi:hypothetical protein